MFSYVNKSAHNKSYQFDYGRLAKALYKLIDDLQFNPAHKGHDGRKHFVTMAKKHSVDEYAIKYIVGHKIDDLTERVYTQREFDWLASEMKKIK